jgi:hypothetical protein
MKMSNLDEMQHGLVNQFLQICRDKLPTKMRSSFYLSDVQHFVDIDNQMQLITLQFKGEANIPILIHFLTSSRADRQQRVIYIHLSEEEEHLAQKILDAIKQVRKIIWPFKCKIPGISRLYPTFATTICHHFIPQQFEHSV